MEPSLIHGDIILVSKMSYGTRLLNPISFFKKKKIKYTRILGWNRIRRGDIFVFNWPQYNTLSDSSVNIYGGAVVKRCFGMPGDCVIIKNEKIKGLRNEVMINNRVNGDGLGEDLFPHDTTLEWSIDNYGPLYVPARGESIYLTSKNLYWYKDALAFENYGNHLTDNLIKLQNDTLPKYIFRDNYYFMVGDNFYHSKDSRYWGFVPEGNIIGKTVLVLCSFDPNKSGLRKLRWNRLLHIINK